MRKRPETNPVMVGIGFTLAVSAVCLFVFYGAEKQSKPKVLELQDQTIRAEVFDNCLVRMLEKAETKDHPSIIRECGGEADKMSVSDAFPVDGKMRYHASK